MILDFIMLRSSTLWRAHRIQINSTMFTSCSTRLSILKILSRRSKSTISSAPKLQHKIRTWSSAACGRVSSPFGHSWEKLMVPLETLQVFSTTIDWPLLVTLLPRICKTLKWRSRHSKWSNGVPTNQVSTLTSERMACIFVLKIGMVLIQRYSRRTSYTLRTITITNALGVEEHALKVESNN